MSKPNRGKNIRRTDGWRGPCPACDRKRARLLWEIPVDGSTVKVCKRCKAADENKARNQKKELGQAAG